MVDKIRNDSDGFYKEIIDTPLSPIGKTILNNLDSSIYIADMETYEILFINDHLKNLFGTDLTGNICWKSFHEKLKGPCEFCTNNKLLDANQKPNKPYIWDFYNHKFKKWYELHDQAVLWGDSCFVRMEIATDITDRKYAEHALKKSYDTLEWKVKERTLQLEDMNAALRVLLKSRENDKKSIEENLLANFRLRLLPSIERLKNELSRKEHQALLTILQSELEDIISPFSKKLSDPSMNLTPMEIQIASMIKFGKSNKEIAIILNRSVYTIANHRENMRKKLGLQNKKKNLRTFLANLY